MKKGLQMGSTMCLLVALLSSAKLVAQPQALVAECDGWSRKVTDVQSLLNADYEAVNRAKDGLSKLHDTLRGYVAQVRANSDQSDQVIRAILVVLPQLRQARADVKAASKKVEDDIDREIALEGPMQDCFNRLQQARSTIPGGGAPGTIVVTLTALDRTEIVNVSLNNGNWQITGRQRQGIKLPSRDPAASDTTGPVKADRRVTAQLSITPRLPASWSAWLGIGADSRTPLGETLCGGFGIGGCASSSGPYPGVRRGFGRGWAAGESAEVWLCHGAEPCFGKTDPVAVININWVLP